MSLKIGRIAALTATLGAIGAMFVATTPASASNIIKLPFKNWVVSGFLTPKLLNEQVAIPKGATFNGGSSIEVIELGNLHGTLTGTVFVPDFTAKLKLLGLVPTEVGLTFTQVGPANGTVASAAHSNCTGPGSHFGPGSQQCTIVNVPTHANLGITMLNAGLGLGPAEVGIGATTKCETAEPILFPLSGYVTLLELITTGPTFTGTATIPPIKCEGLEGIALGLALTAVMSGPENAYSLGIAPPPS
jgi:hypothetical protein